MTRTAQRKHDRLADLKPRAWIGYLIGYSSSNIYRIWVPLLDKVIKTKDITFNELKFFNGNIDTLRDDIRNVDTEKLARNLASISVIDEEPSKVEEEDRGLIAPEDEEFFDIEDEEEEIGEEVEAFSHPSSSIPEPIEKSRQPFPTPPETPPAALFSLAAGDPQESTSTAEPLLGPSPDLLWQAAFVAGSHSSAVAKVNGKNVDKDRLQRLTLHSVRSPRNNDPAKFKGKNVDKDHLQRLIRNGTKIHQSMLPLPPRWQKDLKDHPMGQQFIEAQEAHLASHREMKTWYEVS